MRYEGMHENCVDEGISLAVRHEPILLGAVVKDLLRMRGISFLPDGGSLETEDVSAEETLFALS